MTDKPTAAHDFDRRLAAMCQAADSDPTERITVYNRFTAELAAEGRLDGHMAQILADLQAAGLMPALRYAVGIRAKRRASQGGDAK